MTKQQYQKAMDIVRENIHRSTAVTHAIIKSHGITIGNSRVVQLREWHYHKQEQVKSQPIFQESEIAQSIKWVDTNPDRIQDHPLFDSMMRKFEKENQIRKF